MSGTSGLFSFESAESPETMRAWAERLKYFKIGVSWGGFESLVTVGPAPAPYAAPGARSLVRLHVGLESADDLIRDLEEAWAQVADETKR